MLPRMNDLPHARLSTDAEYSRMFLARKDFPIGGTKQFPTGTVVPRRNRVPKNMEREDNFLGVPRFGFVGTSIENWDPDLQIDFEKIKKK